MNDMNCAATPSDTMRVLNKRRSIIGTLARSSHQIKHATNATNAAMPAITGA